MCNRDRKRTAEVSELCGAARVYENERVEASKAYASLSDTVLSVIIKCVFMLRGETGFFKISDKEQQVMYVDSLGNVSALLQAGVLESVAETETTSKETPRVARAEGQLDAARHSGQARGLRPATPQHVHVALYIYAMD